jgi:hypothetical protein
VLRPRQHFHADDLPVAQVDFGLIPEIDPAGAQRVPQIDQSSVGSSVVEHSAHLGAGGPQTHVHNI